MCKILPLAEQHPVAAAVTYNRATGRSATESESEFRATTTGYTPRQLVPLVDRSFSYLCLFLHRFVFARQSARGRELAGVKFATKYDGEGGVLRIRGRSFIHMPRTKSKTSKRTVVEPHKGDRRYVRRNRRGQFKEEVNVGRSLAADRPRKARTKVKAGQGDRGDVSR